MSCSDENTSLSSSFFSTTTLLYTTTLCPIARTSNTPTNSHSFSPPRPRGFNSPSFPTSVRRDPTRLEWPTTTSTAHPPPFHINQTTLQGILNLSIKATTPQKKTIGNTTPLTTTTTMTTSALHPALDHNVQPTSRLTEMPTLPRQTSTLEWYRLREGFIRPTHHRAAPKITIH